MNYENEFLEYLEGLVGDLDKRIRRGRERLQRSADHKEKVCLTGLKLLPTKYCVCVCARMHSMCVCSVCMHVTMSVYMCAVCVLCVCVCVVCVCVCSVGDCTENSRYLHKTCTFLLTFIVIM